MGDESVLRVEGLKKAYGDFTAVHDLSLEVRRGEVLGFLGPNGAGKTTSISMMCGLLKPTAGTVFLKGKPMGSTNEDRLKVGLCPQHIVVWDRLKCLEQLVFMGEMYGLGAATSRTRGLELLDLLGLKDKANSLASQLSGGMQRRLNIALALIHDPEIVVFDEPEAGGPGSSAPPGAGEARAVSTQKLVVKDERGREPETAEAKRPTDPTPELVEALLEGFSFDDIPVCETEYSNK